MARPDSPFPDDFPDLTLPERTDKVPPPPPSAVPEPAKPYRPEAQLTGSYWRVGSRVLAPWEAEFLYTGVIAQIEGDQALIDFANDDSGWVHLGQVRMPTLKRADSVFVRAAGGSYQPAQVLETEGQRVHVVFDDDTDAWVDDADLRIPCQPSGPPAEPVERRSHLGFFDDVGPGARVWAPWNASALFVGTVDDLTENEAHIRFDDGDCGWVQRHQLRPLDISVGLRVLGRWKMGSAFYPGRIAVVEADRVYIHYDDGDKEWARHAALALPCQPQGPDARPTTTAAQASGGWGWLIWIGIVAFVILSRCR